MSHTTKAPTAARSRRRYWIAAAIVLLAGVGTVWWFTRGPQIPPPPEPDLSHADSEVVAAVKTATDRVRQNPKDADAWGQLGMVLRAHDLDVESVAALRTAERLDSSDYRWPYLQGLTLVLYEPDVGLDALRRAADRAPRDQAGPRLRLAEVLLERGQVDEAERVVGDATSQRAQWIKARTAAERGDWARALERAKRCGADPGCRKKAAMLRGEALARLGRSAEADAELQAAATMPDDLPWPDPVVEQVENLKTGTAARLARAVAQEEQGRSLDAVATLRDAIRQAPSDPTPRLWLGELLVRAGDPASARPVLLELTSRFPDSIEGWFQLGVSQFLLDDARTAAESFRKAIALKPDHALAHFNLGHCLRKLGDRTAARSEFEQALRCRPDHEPSRKAIQELDAGK